jgi:hypothetical protein
MRFFLKKNIEKGFNLNKINMRQTTVLVALFVAILVAFATPMMAIVQTPTDVSTPTLNVVQQQKNSTFIEKIKGLESKITQKADDFFKVKADFKDGTKKWLWFAAVAAAASIVLAILKMSFLSSLAWSACGILLLVWLLKYLEII